MKKWLPSLAFGLLATAAIAAGSAVTAPNIEQQDPFVITSTGVLSQYGINTLNDIEGQITGLQPNLNYALELTGSTATAITIASTVVVPNGAYLAHVKGCAGGGGGGVGGGASGGGGGGGAGGAGAEGWMNVSPGQAITGSIGAAGGQTVLYIGGTLVLSLQPGGYGAAGGSGTVSGSIAGGSITYAPAGWELFGGGNGGNGYLGSNFQESGGGGSSMYGPGGLFQIATAVGAGVLANGNGPTAYCAGGAGGIGMGIGSNGGPGKIHIDFFGSVN